MESEVKMLNSKIESRGITFDDVLLIPAKSDFVPSQANTSTQLTNNIRINIPIVSAAMDTVTESALAIALAQEGGIGIIHKNLSIEAQRREVCKVKRSEHGVILDPVTFLDLAVKHLPVLVEIKEPDEIRITMLDLQDICLNLASTFFELSYMVTQPGPHND